MPVTPKPLRGCVIPRPPGYSLRHAALLALALAAGGCALRGEDSLQREQLLSEIPANRLGCVVETEPRILPPANRLVDSVALTSELATLRDAEEATGHVLISLAYDRAGINIRRDLLEHSTTPLIADSVQRMVFAARQEQEEAIAEWGARLRIDFTEPITLRVGRRESCPPDPRDRQLREAVEGAVPQGLRLRRGTRDRRVVMRTLVNEAGLVVRSQIVRGDLGGSTLERDLDRFLRQFLFVPATIDGQPVAAWLEIPLRVPY
jgi:hypothetical protein